MRLNVMLEPQEGMSYAQILAVAHRAEQLGFEGLYRSDHYTSVVGRQGLASTDAWVTLAGLARDTGGLRLGTLVSPATFRPAGNLAKVVATTAEMAGPDARGGPRVDLGLGTGWVEEEHRQFGFPFEDRDARFRRLSEHLEAVSGLWDEAQDPFSYHGEFVALDENRFRPKPAPRPRLIVGGSGMRRTPRLAARFADELNGVFLSPAQCAEQRQALAEACATIGRDPASTTYSLMTGCLAGATEREAADRAGRLQEASGRTGDPGAFLDDLAGTWIVGGPDRMLQQLHALADAGVDRVMLQHQLPDEVEMLDVVAEHVAPHLPATPGT